MSNRPRAALKIDPVLENFDSSGSNSSCDVSKLNRIEGSRYQTGSADNGETWMLRSGLNQSDALQKDFSNQLDFLAQ